MGPDEDCMALAQVIKAKYPMEADVYQLAYTIQAWCEEREAQEQKP
jgi:hypothetical protein